MRVQAGLGLAQDIEKSANLDGDALTSLAVADSNLSSVCYGPSNCD
jgi:hypothetical protein